jgi:hypothetical protein
MSGFKPKEKYLNKIKPVKKQDKTLFTSQHE